ncbi:5-amino-6-(5-phospho-D-ribitylamino)uracil phosphatase, chloroplastic [Cucurbita argyrosperma subsp. argyrosperma]|nr:5-amino-6-(5-phospho-D-ribitylamino)uracil phosphatase, chloroplastic [Cucurbita argyrosperma subsp. argyrosperma]
MDCSCSNFRTSTAPLSWTPTSSSRFKFRNFKRFNFNKHSMVAMSVSESGENGSLHRFPFTPNKLFMQEAIGAEYGEGFESFSPDGLMKVDVVRKKWCKYNYIQAISLLLFSNPCGNQDFLNDRLQEGFLKRIRYAMKPDEAYGLVFSWDNVVADTQTLKLNSWKQLASEEGKRVPEDGDMQKLMLYGGADHVLQKLKTPVDGLKEWLDAVSTAHIPCAIVSSLDRKHMLEALDRMSLKKYFQAVVTEEDGMESMAHRFLSAAVKVTSDSHIVKLEYNGNQKQHSFHRCIGDVHECVYLLQLDRKPSKCVVFEDDPRGITAAHNCTMMAIALIGAHPAYDLVQADLAVASFNELSVINLRRLFANKGSTFMELQKQNVKKAPSKRKLTIDTIF